MGGRGLVATAAGGVGEGGVAVDFVCRFWAPNFGIPEDPVTGSAYCGLAPYWSRVLGVAAGGELIGYQASARGGMVRCAVVPGEGGVEGGVEGGGGDRVLIRGYAVSVFKGEIL